MPSILVVGDSQFRRRRLRDMLTSLGYDASEAGSAQAAASVRAVDLPDMIVSDWAMAEMSGLDLCRLVRRANPDGYVYMILLSDMSGTGDVADALAAGADDVLAGPVGPDELRGRLSVGRRLIGVRNTLEGRNRDLRRSLDLSRRLNDDMERDLVEARKFQMSLVPAECYSFAGGRVSFLMQPFDHIGGDLVGRIETGSHVLGLYSIDVSGRGITAALICARISTWFEGHEPATNIALMMTEGGRTVIKPPDQICRDLNRYWLSSFGAEQYLTICIASFDPADGRGAVVQAGHPPPMIQRSGGAIEFLGKGDLPIGLLPDVEYNAVGFHLGPGDRMLMYSDGLTECPVEGDEILHREGLAAILGRIKALQGAELVDAMRLEINTLTAGAEIEDDMSAVLMEYTGPVA